MREIWDSIHSAYGSAPEFSANVTIFLTLASALLGS